VLLGKLREPVSVPSEQVCAPAEAVSSFGEEAFKAAVQKAKDYIVEGDIMQVVLSQRMSKPFGASPLALYRAIRSLNPSPYMFYFNFEEFQVVGASPEILVRLEDGDVTVRPIAGTRKRGATHDEDLALEAELLADEKERAEHTQLLDLGRNDCGRVARTGTVRVTERFTVERYSHVMHIVSNVEGKLKDGPRAGRAARHLPGRHRVRRAQAAGDGDHRRARTHQARHLRRLGGLHRLPRRHGPGHRHPHRGGQGRHDPRPGRRRHRRRLRPQPNGRRPRARPAPRCAPPRSPKPASTRGCERHAKGRPEAACCGRRMAGSERDADLGLHQPVVGALAAAEVLSRCPASAPRPRLSWPMR
jgi:hypothetical protein